MVHIPGDSLAILDGNHITINLIGGLFFSNLLSFLIERRAVSGLSLYNRPAAKPAFGGHLPS